MSWVDTLIDQAKQSGNNPVELVAILARESGFKIDAGNPLSSASGLAQAIEDTWSDYQNKYPILAGKLPTDPDAAALFINFFTSDNVNYFKGHFPDRGEPNLQEKYLYHMLGAGGGVYANGAPGIGAKQLLEHVYDPDKRDTYITEILTEDKIASNWQTMFNFDKLVDAGVARYVRPQGGKERRSLDISREELMRLAKADPEKYGVITAQGLYDWAGSEMDNSTQSAIDFLNRNYTGAKDQIAEWADDVSNHARNFYNSLPQQQRGWLDSAGGFIAMVAGLAAIAIGFIIEMLGRGAEKVQEWTADHVNDNSFWGGVKQVINKAVGWSADPLQEIGEDMQNWGRDQREDYNSRPGAQTIPASFDITEVTRQQKANAAIVAAYNASGFRATAISDIGEGNYNMIADESHPVMMFAIYEAVAEIRAIEDSNGNKPYAQATITSIARTEQQQAALRNAGYTTTQVSAHEKNLAFDLQGPGLNPDNKNGDMTRRQEAQVREILQRHGFEVHTSFRRGGRTVEKNHFHSEIPGNGIVGKLQPGNDGFALMHSSIIQPAWSKAIEENVGINYFNYQRVPTQDASLGTQTMYGMQVSQVSTNTLATASAAGAQSTSPAAAVSPGYTPAPGRPLVLSAATISG